MPNGVSQATSSTPAAPAAPVPKASTRVRAGAAYWPKRPKGHFLTIGLEDGFVLVGFARAHPFSLCCWLSLCLAHTVAAADLSESTADVAV